MNPSSKLRGIVPPLITPLTEDGALDHRALEHLVEHILGGGVHGLFVLGTTGEGPGLSYALRYDLVRRVCGLAKGRVPVLVSVTDTVMEESVALSAHAHACGATAVVVAPPYYFPASQPELTVYFARLAGRIPLPFYLYNLPSLTKVSLGEELVSRTLELPNCRGLKDSSGDLHYFKRMQRIVGASGRHSLFIGPEELLADSLLAGGDGGISGGANAWPSLYTEIFDRSVAGDWAGAVVAQQRVLEVSRRIYSIGGYGATVTKALKASLHCLGLCGPGMAAPHLGFGETEFATLRQELAALGLVGSNPGNGKLARPALLAS
jgi:dihydrodipicolinate synthase/N-acetylneuraminate lyase